MEKRLQLEEQEKLTGSVTYDSRDDENYAQGTRQKIFQSQIQLVETVDRIS